MKVLIAGDFCSINRVSTLFDDNFFSEVLGNVKPIAETAEYSILNFECPVTEGVEKPIEKQGPNLRCSEKGVEAVKWAGFDCVTLANNHFLDYGKEGVENTLIACEKYGIDTVGGGMNLQEASKILYKDIEGKTLAIINCCEHEFSIATKDTAGSNPLNPILQYYAIKEAKEKADYVLVIVHGGHELWQLPSPRMVETYRFFIDAGADAVINHHQHCFSGYEIYGGKPIFYGLGNFCFDRQNYFEGLWEYGYMVCLSLDNKVSFNLIPYEQCKYEPNVKPIVDRSSFEKRVNELNEIISDRNRLIEKTTEYYRKSVKSTHFAFEPYNGKVLKKLYSMGLLPNFINKSKLIKLKNMIICESHRDKTMFYLKQKYDD